MIFSRFMSNFSKRDLLTSVEREDSENNTESFQPYPIISEVAIFPNESAKPVSTFSLNDSLSALGKQQSSTQLPLCLKKIWSQD